jgi:hypothetical protein
MTSSALSWPAFAAAGGEPHLADALPREVHTRRAVWGKVHGARTDYRWIARSAGLDRDGAGLEELIWAGDEEQPARASFWRAVGDRWLAVASYPSRAVDRAGRREFCEKQVLEWMPEGEAGPLPAAALALALLPRVEQLDDSIWWDRAALLCDAPELVLPIPAAASPSLRLDAATLTSTVADGLAAFARAGAVADLRQPLAAFYSALLGGAPLAPLHGLSRPLSAAALAALLLPLPRAIADRLSLAGWLFNAHADLARLSCNWGAVVLPPSACAGSTPLPTSDDGLRLADALLAGTPPAPRARAVVLPAAHPPTHAPAAAEATFATARDDARPGVMLPLRPPEETAPAILRALFEFARACDRRWLAAETLERAFRADAAPLGSAELGLVGEWIDQVAAARPREAHPRQWAVKVDLLRAAALASTPQPETLRRVGAFESGLVPCLLFAPTLVAGPAMLRERLGTAAFDSCVAASRACRCHRLRASVDRWLGGRDRYAPRG